MDALLRFLRPIVVSLLIGVALLYVDAALEDGPVPQLIQYTFFFLLVIYVLIRFWTRPRPPGMP